jgi:hypothetical protein
VRIDIHRVDAAIAEVDHPVGHRGDRGIVGDDRRGSAELAVDPLQHLEHHHARLGVQRARWLVTEQYLGALGNRARNRDPLLLTARELRRKVIEPLAKPDEGERLLGGHRVGGDLGHDGDILASRQAGNEVIELKDEAHEVAAELREFPVSDLHEVTPGADHVPGSG